MHILQPQIRHAPGVIDRHTFGLLVLIMANAKHERSLSGHRSQFHQPSGE